MQTAPLVALVASTLAFAAAGCQALASEQGKIPFVKGQGSDDQLTDEQRAVANLAIDALAADLQVPKDKILVDTIRAIDWRDSSIGCPKPGMAYLQVITPGHKVTLRVDNVIYVVHEAKGHAFVCHETKAYAGIDPKGRLVFGPQMAAAQKDLAERLGVPAKDIKAVSAEQTTWNDASLGCPEPGKQYAAVLVTGWVLRLRHGDRDYTYHTDMQHTIPCPAITAD
jgi:hypothetical protein